MATNLINFKQIKDGSLVADAVKLWLTSGYPADKVNTKIIKTPAYVPTPEEAAAGRKPEKEVYYTVEELLADLKKTTDTVLGDGDMSISQMIDAAKKEVQTDLNKLKNKKIRDYVKMTGIINHDGTVILNDPIDRNSASYQKEVMLGLHDGETLGVKNLDMGRSYELYYADNTPVRDKNGNNVTLTFKKNGNGEGVGTGYTEVELAKKKKDDPTFSKYGSIVSDAPYIRDTKVTPHVVEQYVVTQKGSRELQLPHRNIASGSLKVMHEHDYYVTPYNQWGNPGNPELRKGMHDASIDHYGDSRLRADAVKANEKINAPKADYFFNAPAGRILFKHDVDETFTIDYTYETTDIAYVQDTVDKREIKLFPIGTYALDSLDENFLLDNNELNLIAYSKAIDEIVRRLRENDAITEYIASVLATQEVQSAIIERTEQITAQAKADKLELYNHDIDIQNLVRDVAYEVDQLASLNKNADKIDVLEVTISEEDNKDGQIDFRLREIPDKKPVILWINGVRYIENKHFTVDRNRTVIVGDSKQVVPAPQLTWTFTDAKGGFNLYKEDEFDIEAQYNIRTEVAAISPLPYYTEASLELAADDRKMKEEQWKEAVELAKEAGTTPPDRYEFLNARPYNNDLIKAKSADDTYLI